MIRLRPELAGLIPYSSGRSGAASDEQFAALALLASNELAFPPLPSVVEAITRDAAFGHRYPDPDATALREALAARHQLSPDQVSLGAGSVEVARQALFATVGPGDELLVAQPTFPEYAAIVTLIGGTTVTVPTLAWRHDLESMAKAVSERTTAVVVCNPNNPTGTAVEADEVIAFVQSLPDDLLVIVDEAYAEFARPAVLAGPALLETNPNVLVLRTFSKAYGLAGLRVGYGLSSPEVAEALRRTRVPFGCSSLAQAAALASLEAGDELAARIAATVRERERILPQLRALGLEVPTPEGNFWWVRGGDRADELEDGLLARQLLARRGGNAFRITVGTPEENDRLVAALGELLA